jgi:hypothetical protein
MSLESWPRTLPHAALASAPSCQITRVISGSPPGQYVTTGQPASTSVVASLRFIRVVRRVYEVPLGAVSTPASTPFH